MPIPASRETLTGYDLYPSYQARAMGASMALSKQMQRSDMLQLLQALNSPIGQQLVGQINSVNFFRSVFKVFEVPNINQIFTQNPQLAAMVNQVSGGQGLGAIPSSGQILTGGQAPLPGMPGSARAGAGSAASMGQPPDIGKANMLAPLMAMAQNNQ
jgi:hypothetical protein